LLDELISANKRKSIALITGFVVLVVLVAFALSVLFTAGGWVGMVVALAVAGGLAFLSYWKSDAVALAMSRARPADPQEYRRLYNVVEGLCIAGGIPQPRIYIIDDVAPNAFATGRNPQHAAIAVTTGLLEMMDRVELEGVIAHELSHIRNYDILVSTLAVTMVGAIALVSDFGIRFLWWNGGRRGRDDREGGNPAGFLLIIVGFMLLILAPIVARLLQFAISRQRESLADASGVALTRYPPGLISALEKLKADTTVTHSASRATAHLWIEQPVARLDAEGRLSRLNRMFDTHPPLDERIAALREL
jgi:heat shock protein HtpX